MVLHWLSCMDQDKKFAQVADMAGEVAKDSDIGKQLIEQFMANNFKIKGKE